MSSTVVVVALWGCTTLVLVLAVVEERALQQGEEGRGHDRGVAHRGSDATDTLAVDLTVEGKGTLTAVVVAGDTTVAAVDASTNWGRRRTHTGWEGGCSMTWRALLLLLVTSSECGKRECCCC